MSKADDTSGRPARIFVEARARLRDFIKAGERGATGRAIFGEFYESGRWGYTLMRRIREQSLVRPGAAPDGRTQVWIATDELREIVEDLGDFQTLLWPGTYHTDLRQKVEALEAGLEDLGEDLAVAATERAAPLDPEPEAALLAATAPPLPEALAAEDDEEPLDQLIRIAATVLENVVFTRDQVLAMRKDIAALKKAWE